MQVLSGKNAASSLRGAVIAVSGLLGAAALAQATPLVSFQDNSNLWAAGLLSNNAANWAVQWTQSVASSNVTLTALLMSNVGPTQGQWYVTRAIGAGATAADVVYSGSYVPAIDNSVSANDFNTLQRTVLGNGLDFAAGTYYLVLDGPDGMYVNNANWVGDFAANITTTLASGFGLGSYYFAGSPVVDAYMSSFAANTSATAFVFEMDEVAVTQIPEPATLTLTAIALLPLAKRRRRDTRMR
jgi:hypothetical protein